MSDITWSHLEELPIGPSGPGWGRSLEALRSGGCFVTESATVPGLESMAHSHRIKPSEDDRVDHGYFSFFAFHPGVRAPIDRLAWDFFQRIEREESAKIEHCYDDQYTASAGQLALIALGRYRMACDLRPVIRALDGTLTQSAKPYDLAAAVLCAREAGATVLDLQGHPLDFPLDATTPVGFAAFTNPQTAGRLAPHLLKSLRASLA